MSTPLDLDIISNLLQNPNNENLNEAFQIFIEYLQSFLGMTLSTPITLILNEKQEQEKYGLTNIFDFGVNKINENLIEIYRKDELLIFRLFRTATYLFLPEAVMRNLHIKIIVNIFIENQLSLVKNIDDWKNIIRQSIVDMDLIYFGLILLEKIFKTPGNYSKFVRYIWNNIQSLDPEDINFIYPFFNRYTDYRLEEVQDEDVIETIRVINHIFNRVKSYRALLDYQNYFKEYTENGIIKTDLSLRKFTSNLQNFQMLGIAPTYQVNWHTLNISNNYFFLKFHPILKQEQLNRIIEKFPFIIAPKVSQSNFSFELSGFFVIPKVYLDDLIKLFEKLEQKGYVIKKYLFRIDNNEFFTNLNIFRNKFRNKQLINPYHKNYENKYELQFQIEYGLDFKQPSLSLEDFLILDKIRFFSYTGFGFERRAKTLQQLKEDLLIESSKHNNNITELERILGIFHNTIELREQFFKYLNNFKKFGFLLFNDVLNNLFKALILIQELLLNNKHIVNSAQFFENIKRNGLSFLIEDNLIINDQFLKKSLYRDIIPRALKSRSYIDEEIKRIELYKDLLNICRELMILDFKSLRSLIENPDLANKVYNTKKERLNILHKELKERDITSKYVEDKLDDYTSREPPTIVPNMQWSIRLNRHGRYIPFLLIEKTSDNYKILRNIKSYFPRMALWQIFDVYIKKFFIGAEFHGSHLTNKENELFFQILYNLFSDHIIYGKHFIWRGSIGTFSMRNFYDFSERQFFYTPNLYNEFFLYVKNIFGEDLRNFKEITFIINEHRRGKGKKITDLITEVSSRREDFNLLDLKFLRNTHLKLLDILSEQAKFKELKKNSLFNKYVKFIGFVPVSNSYGFNQYYLYLRGINPNKIDLKLLFTNTFQSIKFIGSIEDSISFFIKYIFPLETPNKSFLNWHLYSAKDISEYCMFSIKKIHLILNLDSNFTKDGWDFDVNNFKKYTQNILFNPSKKRIKPEKVEFNFKTVPRDDCLGPESHFYQYLTEIYDTTSINIKSLRIMYDAAKLDKIRTLLKEELIFPCIKFENIGLPEKITLIVPDIKKEHIEKLIDIFSFFNLVKIYETEGEFFIYGFPEEKKFEDGLMIKIYFPFKHDIFRFIEVFNLLFEFLQIDYFLIIDSIFDGKNLLKHVYGSLDFLKKYNPLKNLKWNDKDKIWMNHKLFNEKFEPLYPDLLFGDKE